MARSHRARQSRGSWGSGTATPYAAECNTSRLGEVLGRCGHDPSASLFRRLALSLPILDEPGDLDQSCRVGDCPRVTGNTEVVPSRKSASRRSSIDLPEARFCTVSGLPAILHGRRLLLTWAQDFEPRDAPRLMVTRSFGSSRVSRRGCWRLLVLRCELPDGRNQTEPAGDDSAVASPCRRVQVAHAIARQSCNPPRFQV
jgi:hypothetical protein